LQFQKRVLKLGREIKHLEVWVNLKDRVDQVKALLPLIVDMKNPALRPRHWSQLQEEVGKPFGNFRHFPLSLFLCFLVSLFFYDLFALLPQSI
jgi:dynein heavy chain